VAVAATVLAARSITRPLASLTEQARTMARQRLPEAVREVLATPLGDDAVVPTVEPIEVASRDEVGDVAQALNDVQATALHLAVEQGVLRRNLADAFVSLGRRNQNLVSRQLDFVTSLEAEETDPDTLDALFRLDHLATRIRRNAESLLVLAGLETPRRWATPQRLGDVVRSAIGEVADYRRVHVVELPPATVQGFAAADIAHLIAELLDNGLRASASGRRGVEVRGRYQADGGDLLAVVDSGDGMDVDEIAQANRRLAGTESYTVAPSRYLGHYVVGRLAARHGIRTRLAPTYGGGVTALVELPPSVATIEPAHLRPGVGV
jgi:signal transduction histidine kinase